MKVERIDVAAIALFALVSAIGWWLWSGQGPAVWINNFLLLCGFG